MASMQNHATTIQSRLVSGARAGCKVMINATYGSKMQPASHAWMAQLDQRARHCGGAKEQAALWLGKQPNESESHLWKSKGMTMTSSSLINDSCFFKKKFHDHHNRICGV